MEFSELGLCKSEPASLMLIDKLRGFVDLLTEEKKNKEDLIKILKEIFSRFSFEEVEVPILEKTELFLRSVGESSDIVGKEMYSFKKSEEEISLRPEATASIARMVLTNKLQKNFPLRFFYSGPMFRCERPQKGRFRQFDQMGVELLGEEGLNADVEVLSLAFLIVKELGIEKKVVIEINTLGSFKERQDYVKKLKEFFKDKDLSEISKKRLLTNPLRILDSKEKEDREILKKAPLLKESLNKESLKRYEDTKKKLQDLGIPFKENPQLVRGLDYYNDFVFELKSQDLGAQSSFLAGGRYDSLIGTLGGGETPAVGFALGLERLLLLLKTSPKDLFDLGLVAVGEEAEEEMFKRAYELRGKGYSVFYQFGGNFSKQMNRVGKKCRYALIYGEKERKSSQVVFKDLKSGKQDTLPLSSLSGHLEKQVKT